MLGLVLTTDQGIAHVLPGAGATWPLRDVRCTAIDYAAEVAIVAAPGQGAWMHRGERWEQVWEGDARAVRIAPDGACYIGEEPPRLHRSEDRGETWTELENVRSVVRAHRSRTPGASRGDAAIAGIAFPHNQLMLGIRPIGTWLSRDRGQTWMRGDQIQLSARSEPLQAEDLGEHLNGLWEHPLESDRLYAASRRGFFRSEDGGFTWQRSQEGLDRLFVGGLAVLPGVLSGVPDTLLLSAARREPVSDTAPADDGAAAFRSTNGGRAWQRIVLGEVDAWPRLPLVSAVAGETAMLFVLAGGQAWASHDRGARWLPIAGDLPVANAMVAAL